MSSSFAYTNNQSQRHANNTQPPRAQVYAASSSATSNMANHYPYAHPPVRPLANNVNAFYAENPGAMGRGSMPYWRAHVPPPPHVAYPFAPPAPTVYNPGGPSSSNYPPHGNILRPPSIPTYHPPQQQQHQQHHEFQYSSNSSSSLTVPPSRPQSHPVQVEFRNLTLQPVEVVEQGSRYPSGSNSNSHAHTASKSTLPTTWTAACDPTLASFVQLRLLQASTAWAEVNSISTPLSPLHAESEKTTASECSIPRTRGGATTPAESEASSSSCTTKPGVPSCTESSATCASGQPPLIPCATHPLPGTDISPTDTKTDYIPGIDSTPPEAFHNFTESAGELCSARPPVEVSTCIPRCEPVKCSDIGPLERCTELGDGIVAAHDCPPPPPPPPSATHPTKNSLVLRLNTRELATTPSVAAVAAVPVKKQSQLDEHSVNLPKMDDMGLPALPSTSFDIFNSKPDSDSHITTSSSSSSSSLFPQMTHATDTKTCEKRENSHEEEKSFGLKYWIMKANGTAPASNEEKATTRSTTEPEASSGVSRRHSSSKSRHPSSSASSDTAPAKLISPSRKEKRKLVHTSSDVVTTMSTAALSNSESATKKPRGGNLDELKGTQEKKKKHQQQQQVNQQHVSTQITSITLGDVRSVLYEAMKNVRNAFMKDLLSVDVCEVKRRYDEARSELHRLITQRKTENISQHCMTCCVLCVRYALAQDLHARQTASTTPLSSSSSSWQKPPQQAQQQQKTPILAAPPVTSLKAIAPVIANSSASSSSSSFPSPAVLLAAAAATASTSSSSSAASNVAATHAKCEGQLRDIGAEFDKAMRQMISKSSGMEVSRLDTARQMGILGIIAARATLQMDLYHAWLAAAAALPEEFQVPTLPAKKVGLMRTGLGGGVVNLPAGFPLSMLSQLALQPAAVLDYPASNASHETHQESPASTLSFHSGNGSSGGGGGPGSVPSVGSSGGGGGLVGSVGGGSSASATSGGVPVTLHSLASYRVLEYFVRSEELWLFFQQNRLDMLTKHGEVARRMEDQLLHHFPWGLDAVAQFKDDSLLVLCMLEAVARLVQSVTVNSSPTSFIV